jgi:hypothetical protein
MIFLIRLPMHGGDLDVENDDLLKFFHLKGGAKYKLVGVYAGGYKGGPM